MVEFPVAAMASTGIVVGVVLFLVLTTSIGLFSGLLVKKSSRRYMVAGKSLPLFIVGTMLAAAAVDGNGTLGAIGIGYDTGIWGGASIPIGACICLFLIGLFYGAKLNRLSMLTLPDFYYRRYGPNTEFSAVLVMILGFVIMVAGNFAAAAFIFQAVFGIKYIWALLIGAAIVFIYTGSGGMFASAYTDILQIYIAVIGLWAAFIYIAGGFTGHSFTSMWNAAPAHYTDMTGLTERSNGALINWAGILSLAVGDIIALDFMERVFSAKTPRIASRSAIWGGVITASVIVPVIFLAIFGRALSPHLSSGYKSFPDIAIHHVPTVIGALMLAGVIGAAMSTSNSGMLALSSAISRNVIQRNVIKRFLRRPTLGNRQLLLVTRLLLFPCAGFAIWWAYEIPQPGKYAILAFDIVLAGCFWPLTLGLFWHKANAWAAMASIVSGLGARLIGYIVTPSAWSGIETLLSPVVGGIFFVTVALLTQKQNPGIDRWGTVEYIPPEEDIILGDDLRGYWAWDEARRSDEQVVPV